MSRIFYFLRAISASVPLAITDWLTGVMVDLTSGRFVSNSIEL